MHIISENSELSMFSPFQDAVKRSLALFLPDFTLPALLKSQVKRTEIEIEKMEP